MLKKKKRYGRGDLLQLYKSLNAGAGEFDQQKPPAGIKWNIPLDRKDLLFCIRHEAGGGTDRFAGSVLCMTRVGIVWVDSRQVGCAQDVSDTDD